MNPAPDARAVVADARERMRRLDHAGAIRACRTFLKRTPHHPLVTITLAAALGENGESREAVRLLEAAARKHRDHARLRIAIGMHLGAMGRFKEAARRYEAVLKQNPDDPDALEGLADCHERAGRDETVRELLEPRIGSLGPGAGAILVRVLTRAGDLDAAISLGKQVSAGDEETMARRNACFSLAAAFEKQGDHAAALAAAGRGNAILAPAFDADSMRYFFDDIRTAFAAGQIEAIPASGVTSTRPVFVVGMPRCGSTLVERIVASHGDVHGAGETPDFHHIASRLPQLLGSSEPYPHCLSDLTAARGRELATMYLDALKRHDRRASRVVNKDLGNVLYVGLIARLLPGAKVIQVRRNPVDNAVACYMQRLRPSAAPYASRLEDAGFWAARVESLMDHWSSVVPAHVLDVQYEDLVGDPEPQARRIIDFLDLPWDEACLAFHATARVDRTLSYDQVTRPVYRTSVGRAERFGDAISPLRVAYESERDRAAAGPAPL